LLYQTLIPNSYCGFTTVQPTMRKCRLNENEQFKQIESVNDCSMTHYLPVIENLQCEFHCFHNIKEIP